MKRKPGGSRLCEIWRATPPSSRTWWLTTRRRPRAFFRRRSSGDTKASWRNLLSRSYIAGARGRSWLKIKQANTLDLVILAAEWGNGRRQGWLSNLHLGARDTEKGGFAMLGKTFKGLTDEMLAWQTQ